MAKTRQENQLNDMKKELTQTQAFIEVRTQTLHVHDYVHMTLYLQILNFVIRSSNKFVVKFHHFLAKCL